MKEWIVVAHIGKKGGYTRMAHVTGPTDYQIICELVDHIMGLSRNSIPAHFDTDWVHDVEDFVDRHKADLIIISEDLQKTSTKLLKLLNGK